MEAYLPLWALNFDENIKTAILDNNWSAITNYQNFGTEAKIAVPEPSHFISLIYSLALKENDETIKCIYEGFQNGSFSMRSLQIG